MNTEDVRQRFKDIELTCEEALTILVGTLDGMSAFSPDIVEQVVDIVLVRRIAKLEETS